MTDDDLALVETIMAIHEHKAGCESCRSRPVYEWPAACREWFGEQVGRLMPMLERTRLSGAELEYRLHHAVEMRRLAGLEA